MVHLLGLASFALLLIDHSKVEHDSCTSFLCYGDLQVVNGLERVLLVARRLSVVQDADVEVGFEILRVELQSSLVQVQTSWEEVVVWPTGILDASCNAVEGIDVVRVQLQDLGVDLLGLLEVLDVDHEIISLVEHLFHLPLQLVKVRRIQTVLLAWCSSGMSIVLHFQ